MYKYASKKKFDLRGCSYPISDQETRIYDNLAREGTYGLID